MTDGGAPDVAVGREGALRRLHQHTAPRYLVTGGVTLLVDVGCLNLFHGVLRVPLAPATLMAFGIAFVVNFTGSRQWTFARTARGGQAHQQIVRYLILVGINLCSTLLIVLGLSAAGLYYLWAKIAAAAINSVGNYFAYRHWIFAAPPVL